MEDMIVAKAVGILFVILVVNVATTIWAYKKDMLNVSMDWFMHLALGFVLAVFVYPWAGFAAMAGPKEIDECFYHTDEYE